MCYIIHRRVLTSLGLFLTLPALTINLVSSSTVPITTTGTFLMHYNVARPEDSSACWPELTNNRLLCLHLCARNISCASVFVGDSGQGNGEIYECLLCEDVWSISNLASGSGRYAISRFGGRGISAPIVAGAVLTDVGVNLGQLAASYSCTSTGRTFKLAYNRAAGTWPQLSKECGIGLCGVESIQGVLMTLSEPKAGVFRLRPICQADQQAHGYIQCSNRSWSEFDALGRICLPKTCQSRNSRGRSVYQGNLNVTVGGRTCQEWQKTTPQFHLYGLKFFLEDRMSLSTAANYCRDPANHGYVWCYTTSLTKRWNKCAVPSCD